ncbi:ATP-binding cassette domain-containing protein [Roseateles saccharophilus]|uniref:ABC-2 type transport system ATP-binding protein n=1 Tax=Roseateles saccharophilus TaxID=304 RepID=A0A4R3V7U0_ROSSA|nr:ABC transporter ATP-binding protein [Roseateles saccharophilus]MDG0831782.1 ABC transporter ATP-binding protein [Roseateles saccharophilus]TCV01197.1 ABC-2 type transport system ATP-binding protein [Roseateles saccharophilus]
MANEVLVARGLRKAYGERVAVQEVDLVLRPGEVLGLLGPNGAGKSTTVGMICGLTVPDAGTVTLSGGTSLATDEAGYKRRIGLVPQDIALYEELPAGMNVELFGALYGMAPELLKRRRDEVLAMVGLADRARDKPSTFSGGMKRRLNIACALVHDPEILLLDEPTAGVDPQSRNAIFDNLEMLKRAGKALVYTTHYMEEAERLADRITIIDHGRVVAEGRQAELFARLPAAQTLHVEIAGEPDDALLAGLPGVKRSGQRLDVSVGDIARDAGPLLAALAQRGVEVRGIASARATLEDVFLALTGRQLRD